MGGKGAAMLFPQDAVERSMKVRDVIVRAIAGQLSWLKAVEILGLSPRSSSPRYLEGTALVRTRVDTGRSQALLPAIPWSRGLSRRRLGWRGDLCAVVPAASGTGVRSSGWSSSTSREFPRGSASNPCCNRLPGSILGRRLSSARYAPWLYSRNLVS